MSDEALDPTEQKSCALPGCDVAIVDVPGRPARRYCSAAHRHAARAARRAAMRPDVAARLTETLPWLQEPAPVTSRTDVRILPRPGAPRSAAARLPARPRRPVEVASGRRRAAAVLGAVGILAGGYAITAAVPLVVPSTRSDQTGQATSGADWATRAEVTLASLTKQLDTIARTEEAYSRLSPDQRTSVGSGPYAALQQRKSLLQRRKAALQSQLDNYRALGKARAELAASQSRLDAVDKAIEQSPSRAPGATEAATAAALDEQRTLRERQRDARKAELASLQDSVDRAARAPLPSDEGETDAVSAGVFEAIERGDGGRGPSRRTAAPAKPDIVAGRSGQDQERQDTSSSGPPDPRGPADDEPRDRGAPPSRSPLGDALGNALGSVGNGVDAATRAGHGKAPKPADRQATVRPEQARKPAAAREKTPKDGPKEERRGGGLRGVLNGAENALNGGLVGDRAGPGSSESARREAPKKAEKKAEKKPAERRDEAGPRGSDDDRGAGGDRSAIPQQRDGLLSRLPGIGGPTGVTADDGQPGTGLPRRMPRGDGSAGDGRQEDRSPSRTRPGTASPDGGGAPDGAPRGDRNAGADGPSARSGPSVTQEPGSRRLPPQRSQPRTRTAPEQRSTGGGDGEQPSRRSVAPGNDRGSSTITSRDESGTSTVTRDRNGITASRTTPDGRQQSVRVGNDGSVSVRDGGETSRPSTKSRRQAQNSGVTGSGSVEAESSPRRSGSDEL